MATILNNSVEKSASKILSGFLKSGSKPINGRFQKKTKLSYDFRRTYRAALRAGTLLIGKDFTSRKDYQYYQFTHKNSEIEVFELEQQGINFSFRMQYCPQDEKFSCQVSASLLVSHSYQFQVERVSEIRINLIRTVAEIKAVEAKIDATYNRPSSLDHCFLTESPKVDPVNEYDKLKAGKWKNKTMRRKHYSLYRKRSLIPVWCAHGSESTNSSFVSTCGVRSRYSLKHALWLKQHGKSPTYKERDIRKTNSLVRLSRRDRVNHEYAVSQINEFEKESAFLAFSAKYGVARCDLELDAPEVLSNMSRSGLLLYSRNQYFGEHDSMYYFSQSDFFDLPDSFDPLDDPHTLLEDSEFFRLLYGDFEIPDAA